MQKQNPKDRQRSKHLADKGYGYGYGIRNNNLALSVITANASQRNEGNK